MVGSRHDSLDEAGMIGSKHDSLDQAGMAGSRHDSLDQAGMVGSRHDGDLPEQHLGGLAVQHALVDNLDRHSL